MARLEYSLGAVDFVIFLSTVLLSLLLGLYQAVWKKKQDSSVNYFTGEKKISLIPVSMSLAVSFLSSIIVLGFSAEVYHFGTSNAVHFAMCGIGFSLAGWIIAPVLHSLNITSTYQYLEFRFKSKPVRLLGAALGILQNVIYSGAVIFGPAVAIEAVSGFPTYGSILITVVAAVIYTTIGGFTAVIWTDVFQLVAMVTGLLIILIKSFVDIGSLDDVWQIGVAGKRLRPLQFNFDPTTRTSFWTAVIGGFGTWFSMAFSQQSVQRIVAMKKVSQAKKLLPLSMPACYIMIVLVLLEGLVVYAYYTKKRCDPFVDGSITDPNAILAYYVMDVCRDLPGLPGIFLASLFSASLSTISSCLNSISAIALKDFVEPHCPDLTNRKSLWIARLLVVIFGAAATAVAFLMITVKGPLTQFLGIFIGAVTGPNCAMFMLGMFFPWINSKGAFTGVMAGMGMTYWVAFGATTVKVPPLLPALSDQCGVNASVSDMNVTGLVNMTSLIHDLTVYMENDPVFTDIPYQGWGLKKLYAMSFTTYPVLGILVAFPVGIIVSLVTGRSDPVDVDPRCISPLVRRFYYKDYTEKISREETLELTLAEQG